MKQKIDLSTWNRKEHFEFFCTFEEPFFGITTQIDMTIEIPTQNQLRQARIYERQYTIKQRNIIII